MISLHKSVTELERWEALQKTTLECYRQAIRSIREFALEVDPADWKEHRERLAAIERQVGAEPRAPELVKARESLTGELGDYHDRGQNHLGRLRSELEEAMKVMQQFADAVSENGDGAAEKVRAELAQMRLLENCDDLDQLRVRLRTSIERLGSLVERIQQQNQYVVAQLTDEIRVLHDRVKAAQKANALDPSTGVYHRLETAARIERSIEGGNMFSLLFISIRNFRQLQWQRGRQAVEDLAAAMCRRLRKLAGAEVERWGENEFVMVLTVEKAEAMNRSRDLASRLAADESGPDMTPLQIATGVVDYRGGESASQLFDRAEKLLHLLSGEA